MRLVGGNAALETGHSPRIERWWHGAVEATLPPAGPLSFATNGPQTRFVYFGRACAW
jgi:hypothetical protein